MTPAADRPHATTRVVDQLAARLARAGIRRLFGVPGGGSIAELIEAAGLAGIPFVLAHTETAAAFMAAAEAELGVGPGVCLATLGPGAAAIVNGVAQAWLDRVPLLVITDCIDPPAALHQRLPQTAMFAPITKASLRLDPARADEQFRDAIALALEGPPGPVHLDLSIEAATAPAAPPALDAPSIAAHPVTPFPASTIAPLARARRPLVLAGLGAAEPAVAAAVTRLAERARVPVLVTYKGKGVLADRHPWHAGTLTNGALERPVLEAADLFLAVGLDAVELLPRPWPYPQPMIQLMPWLMAPGQLPEGPAHTGDLAALVDQADRSLAPSAWEPDRAGAFAEAARAAMRVPGAEGGLHPHRVVELVAAARPDDRVTIDAGAHMFPAVALWPASRPRDLMISNGLSTMGYALPTAIGAALADGRPVTVLTGDGGLLMCLAELRTAARERLPIRIVVFDDRALSLIKIKQQQRGFRTEGVGLDGVDWPTVARGCGVTALAAANEAELIRALAQAAAVDGPVLIAAAIDPTGYRATMTALRGSS